MTELTPYLKERLEEAKRDLARQKDWYRELSSYELCQINGLVSLSYPHGDSVTKLDEWTVIFTFDGWTDSEGGFHEEELVIRKVVQQEESDRIKELVQPRSIITISCHIGIISEIDRKDAALVSILSSDASDERLERYRSELEAPIILSTGTFGDLKLDRSVNWFEGEVRSGLRKIRISIEPKSISDSDAAVTEAERIWANRKKLIELAKEQAVNELLDDKNGCWLNDGEKPLHPSKFKKCMKLYSITISEGGSYEFWFRDGGLFWGHDIDVMGDDARGFYQAGIQG